MTRWAIRTLFDQPASLLASALGVGIAFVLALFLEAIYAGEASQIIAYPSHSDADVWVMQDGVANMHMATSLLASDVIEEIRAVPGVADATPILYQSTFLQARGSEWLSYIVGIQADAARGAPWSMSSGHAVPRPGEAIVSDVLARQAGLQLGDTVRLSGRDLIVAGMSSGTWSMANTVTWIAYSDLADILSATRAVSYVLVKARSDTSPERLAAVLRERIAGINALTRESFIENDRQMAMQMGGYVIRLMLIVGSIIGALVVAFAVYAAASRHARELAVIKALGARSSRLYGSILLQTGVIASLGYGFAVALVAIGGPLIHAFVPAVTLQFSMGSILRLGGFALVVAAAASLVPARRVANTDPVSVFAA